MCDLHNKNCFEFFDEYKNSNLKKIDCVIVDLPYGQTENKWDVKIDLEKMWSDLKQITKKNCMFVFFTTTKFGIELINSNPSDFRYDLIWEKTNPVGHLSVKKIPLRKHEMIYIFSGKCKNDNKREFNLELREYSKKLFNDIGKPRNELFKKCGNFGLSHFIGHNALQFGIPTNKNYQFLIDEYKIDEFDYFIKYSDLKNKWSSNSNNPPYNPQMTKCKEYIYKKKASITTGNYGTKELKKDICEKRNSKYPTSILKYSLDKEKLHSTQKPVKLLEWLIKTYSNEGDIICDFTMGSGSSSIAAFNTKRKFIGVEMDKEIFEIAKKRITDHSNPILSASSIVKSSSNTSLKT
jgi:hypothetical protein